MNADTIWFDMGISTAWISVLAKLIVKAIFIKIIIFKALEMKQWHSQVYL